MATAWRIVKTKYRAEAFNGEGARLYGGRWTSEGRRAIYVSSRIGGITLPPRSSSNWATIGWSHGRRWHGKFRARSTHLNTTTS